MDSPFDHIGIMESQIMYDFDATSPTFSTFLSGYIESFRRPQGPTGEEPTGVKLSPKWWITFDISQIAVVASFADGGRGRDYNLVFDIWSEPKYLADVFREAGKILIAYLAGLAISGWSIFTDDTAPALGIAEVGGFAGQTFNVPAIVS